MEQLMGLKEASAFLGLSPATLYKYINQRKVPFTKIGSRVLFKPEALREWVEEKSVPVGGSR